MAYFDDTYTQEPQNTQAPKDGFTPMYSTEFLPYDLPFDNVKKRKKRQRREKSERKGGFWKVLLCTILILALTAGSCFATAYYLNEYWTERYTALNQTLQEAIAVMQQKVDQASSGQSGAVTDEEEGPLAPAEIYSRNVNSVVAITNVYSAELFGQQMESASAGSGFILTEDGYVVSNHHVVADATKLTVTTHDGTEYEAKLIGSDSTNDIALLKIEAQGLPAVKLGSSDNMVVGEKVCVIGNPLGELASTLTVGYVSAKDRIVSTDGTSINMMQTDAAVNSGNSGGPMFNMNGEVVGIITAKYTGTSGSGATIEGIGFAIPIDDVTGMLEDLKNFGYVTGAYLGVLVTNVNEAALMYGIPEGAFVQEVTPGYAAEKAGLQAQDIITNLGGHAISNINDLGRALRKFKAGDTASVTVFRAGRIVNLVITFDEKPVG